MHPDNARDNPDNHIERAPCLRAIFEKFERLNSIKEICSKDFGAGLLPQGMPDRTNEMLESFIDPIDDELLRLGWLAAEVESTNSEFIQRKADILNALLEDDASDLVVCLTRSLINDLQKL